MNESHIRNVIEAALLAAGKPLQPAELVELFDEGARPQLQDVTAALTALMAEYSNRGIEIKETAAGFRIQVRREMANEISRLWPERPARYSRALLETLALIAYRQPITRAEIEAVRGVAVNPNILKTVIERNWVRVVGHRDVPGRPELLGTTRDFLDYFGLKNLDELPPLAELKTIVDIKVQFDLPDPGPIPLASEANGEAGTPEAAAETASAQESAPAAGSDGKEVVSEDVVQHSAVADETAAHDTSAHEAATLDAAIVDAASEGAIASGETAVDPAVRGSIADAPAEQGTAVANSATAANSTLVVDNTRAPNSDMTGGDGVAAANAGDENAVAEGAAVRKAATSPTDGASDTSHAGGGKSVRKRRGKARASDTALHEAEEFAASIDADLAAGDDDGSDDDELSAAGPDSSELVAGPRDIDD
jgi:segregation and condensation protein B